MLFFTLEPSFSNKDKLEPIHRPRVTSVFNPLYKNGVTDKDDCVATIDNQCYTEQVGSNPKYEEEQRSCNTWQVIVVEEVSLLDLFQD